MLKGNGIIYQNMNNNHHKLMYIDYEKTNFFL
jgi:hypothetical protein